ncbi:MAG: FG-GAP-like repeat-containing protein [Candidatus Thermoplasmatota archaeon]|jgi:hypothetical protein|nr:FG-GAP-like repeat-containing protein [Candidatus Thermoplasmatota archaeon]
MMKKILSILFILIIGVFNVSIVSANLKNVNEENYNNTGFIYNENYTLQWVMNFGSDWDYGARYEGPQPIGDCDNDGKNEMLVGGRDGKIRVFEWDQEKQTYLEMHTIFCPLYPFASLDPGGFAIGDLDGDGKNEIGATFGISVHKWIFGRYKTIGFNNLIFLKGGGSADCYIGDYDNDGKNELIVSGGPIRETGLDIPEIVIFKLTKLGLFREASWNSPEKGYVYMAGLGDVDDDGENEIVCGTGSKFYVLDWNKQEKKFDETILENTTGDYYPFACVCKDSTGDGKLEIHISYARPKISIYKWNGNSYERIFVKEWYGESGVIEGLDVGNVDDDSMPEVCVGTNVVHILSWNGETYVEKDVLPTFGNLAVVAVGDCDNDGKNEIQAGSVMTHFQDFMSWVFKYNYTSSVNTQIPTAGNGRINVNIKRAKLGLPISNASVAAWNLETGVWYDIQPKPDVWSIYSRSDLPEGQYLLRAHMEGFKNQEATISIYTGQETSYTFYLSSNLLNRQLIKNPLNIITRFLNINFF